MLSKERSEDYQFQLWKTKGVRICNVITYKILAGLIRVYSTRAKPHEWLLVQNLSAAEIHRTAYWSWDYPFIKSCAITPWGWQAWFLNPSPRLLIFGYHLEASTVCVHTNKHLKKDERRSVNALWEVLSISTFITHLLPSFPAPLKEMWTLWLKVAEWE